MGIIQYKTDLLEETPFKELDIQRRGVTEIVASDVKNCYTEPTKINPNKKKDLLDMLPLINGTFHDFYRNLVATGEESRDIDPDLSEQSDAEN